MPAAPSTTEIEDLQRLVGNEQLVVIKDKAALLEARIKQWKAAAELAQKRLPAWTTVESLARHCEGIDGGEAIREQVDAVRGGRLLLEPIDPVAPLRMALAKLARGAVDANYSAHTAAYKHAMATLTTNGLWSKIEEAARSEILAVVGLTEPAKPDVSTDEALVELLDRRPLSTARAEVDAVPGRVAQAIERAAKRLEPKVQAVAIERATLRTEADLDAWLGRQRETLSTAIKQGPVLVS
jgi:hypothetical protein